MKKMLSAILTLVIMLPSLISCNDNPTQTTAPEGGTTGAETTVGEITESFIEPDIPEKDFQGETFNILYPEWGAFTTYIFSEELTGDVINDTVYDRNRTVEERVNVTIAPASFPETGGVMYAKLSTAVAAGDAAYDLALTHCIDGVPALVQGKYVANWNDVPHVDFSKPYWNQYMNETLEIAGVLPFAASDFVIPDPNCIPFNKRLIEDYTLENPYDLVRDGTWTWDKLAEMASAVSLDLDGDSKFTNADQYGFACEVDWMLASILHSCDQYVVGFNDSGVPEIVLNNEKTVNIISMIYSLLLENDATFTYAYNQMKDAKNGLTFDSNRVLFYMRDVKSLSDYRNMEDDFGVLPYPKYDEGQDQYYSLNWSGLMCIPAVVKDLEMSGIVTELLSAETRRTLLPAYFDVLLEGKVARDEETKEMLQLIFDTCVYDFGLNYSNYSSSLYIVSKMIQSKSTDVSSFLASITKSENKTYEKIYEAFLAYQS